MFTSINQQEKRPCGKMNATPQILDPVAVSRANSFFWKEADELRTHLSPLLKEGESDLFLLIEETTIRLADATKRFALLSSISKSFMDHSEALAKATAKFPGIASVADAKGRAAIAADHERNFPAFRAATLKLLDGTINSDWESTKNFSWSISTDAPCFNLSSYFRDRILREHFAPDATHLIFWDIKHGLGIRDIAMRELMNIERRAGELEQCISGEQNSKTNDECQSQLSVLNQLLANLPELTVSPHRFKMLLEAVDTYCAERVARLYPETETAAPT